MGSLKKKSAVDLLFLKNVCHSLSCLEKLVDLFVAIESKIFWVPGLNRSFFGSSVLN